MKKRLGCLLLVLLLLPVLGAIAAEEEKLIPKSDEIVIAAGESVLTRYSSTTNAMKIAGVTYATSDESIAVVSQKGYVRGVSAGECVLTITSRHNPSVTAEIRVRVVVPLTKIAASLPKTLYVGDRVAIDYTLVPENTTERGVQFASNKEAVATVDQEGLVTALSRGEAAITLRGENGKTKAVLRFKVKQRVESISLDQTEILLPVGKEKRIRATVLPQDADNTKVKWSSTDAAIAKVSENGRVTAVAEGKAILTVCSAENPEISQSMVVQCVNPVKSIRFERDSFVLGVEDTVQLQPIVKPENATFRDVVYHVANPDVCKVDESGVVTPLRSGITKVTAVSADGTEKKASVTVRCIVPAESMAFGIPAYRLAVGTHAFVKADVRPTGSNAVGIAWTSSNPLVATVTGDENRPRIQAHSWGKCVISGRSADGKLNADLQVLVGALHDAIQLESVRAEDGRLYATLFNPTDMHISYIAFAAMDSAGNTAEAEISVDLPAGATLADVPVECAGIRQSGKSKLAVSYWETDTGYCTNQMQTRNAYRIAPGLMNWVSAR